MNNVVIYQKGDEVHEKKIIQYSPVYMYGIYNDTNGRWGVFAATATSVEIGTADLNSTNMYYYNGAKEATNMKIEGQEPNATFSKGTLTINGLVATGILTNDDLIVKLTGEESRITATGIANAIYAGGDLTITGSGTLITENGNNSRTTIFAGNNMTINGGAKVNAVKPGGGAQAMDANTGNVIIFGTGTKVVVSNNGVDRNSNAIRAKNGNGTIKVSAGAALTALKTGDDTVKAVYGTLICEDTSDSSEKVLIGNSTYHWHECTNHITKNDVAEHNLSQHVTVPATCTDSGKCDTSCIVCGAKLGEQTIKPKGHQFAEVWSSDNEYHWHAATCSHSEEKGSYSKHVYGTEGDARYVCTICKDTNSVRQANIEAADNVDTLINGIGAVEYTDECKTKIDAAREAYNNLTNEQRDFVNNESMLTDAETAYANLKATADQEAANAVIALIKAIGNVEYTDECKTKIDVAREAYNNLTNEQRDFVNNESMLTDAETAYANLKATAEKEAADQEAANAVIALIKAIGNVEYTDESKAKIDKARAAYDKLTDDQKHLVNNYSTLTEAEKRYKELANTRPGGHYKPTQKPEIIAGEGSQGDLTLNGTKVTITVEEGYELVDVLVNGISKGKVTELTGLKTGDKVEIKTEKIPEKLEPQAVKDLVKELKLVARSERLSNGNVRIKVTKITDINDNPVDLNELEKNGYTVKFKYYRSVKKSAGYDTRLEKDADINSYINNFGDKGTKYYYKVKVMVYDADGNLVAQSSLNQCKYAMRTWIK